MRFWRAHGLGNDYLVLESGEALGPELVRALCDRHTGVGSDGILEPTPGGLRIHNPDGSEAEKSGNGLRIFAHWLVRRRAAAPEFELQTRGGAVRCAVHGDRVQVDMGPARVGPEVELAGTRVIRVDLGNPHAVALGIPSDWLSRGPRIETAVPGRTNVQFVEIREGVAHARIWERGAGHTRSSGSSACAVAAVCVDRGLLPSPLTVRMEGGDLSIEVGATVRMEGPVEAVGLIELLPSWLEARRAGGGHPPPPPG